MVASDAALNALGHAVSGSAGTAISTAALYPLDLVTTRLKAQRQLEAADEGRDVERQRHHYDGVVDAFRNIVGSEGGASALYGGLGPDVAKSVTDSFLFFGFYNYLRRYAGSRNGNGSSSSIVQELALGALAGACSKAVTTPISNVVTRKQTAADDGGGGGSLWDMLAAMKKESGLLGLWTGYSATLLLTLNPSITFFVNRRLARRIIPALEEEDVPIAWAAFLVAAVSKATATAVTYPFQTGKTRLQMASVVGSDNDSNDEEEAVRDEKSAADRRRVSLARRLLRLLNETIFGVMARVISREGLRALYDGLQGELLKSFFSHGLTMLTKGLIHRLVIRLWFTLSAQLRQRRLQAK